MSFGVGIIGCGVIGQKRAKSLGQGRLVACADIKEEKAKSLAQANSAKVFSDWQKLLKEPEVDIAFVATPHNLLAEITQAAIEAGKHVLVEKPAARNLAELEPVILAATRSGVKVRVGFNHRYHRAFRNARELFETGQLGELMFIRARYGHGGRLGYEKEWRADPELSGGGELLDQGTHLIDLSRWFLGDFSEVHGFTDTYYWDMPVDDNGFMLLKTANRRVAFLHASCTEWKNLFSMEIYGRNGKADISGLGGSYGVERLTLYKMLPQMGLPKTTVWEYSAEDDSLVMEIAEFYDDIRLNRTPAVGLKDAYEALKVVEKIYKESGYDHHT